jgi:multisubunit Na+/H+ antiporter MnhC subunit
MGYGVCLFFVMLGYKAKAHAPVVILDAVKHAPEKAVEYVDPLIQALIPAIMFINLAAIGLMLATCIRLYEKYWIFDISKIKDLKG